jgi:HD-like signal output (HDOD) protein
MAQQATEQTDATANAPTNEELKNEQAAGVENGAPADTEESQETATENTPASSDQDSDSDIIEPGSGPPVFVVDKDRGAARVISKIAHTEGCSVYVYKVDASVVTHMREIKPFMMFLDCDERNKYFSPLCKAAQSCNVALILMKANPARSDVHFAFHAGAIDFLVKPVTQHASTAKILNGLAFATKMLNRQQETTDTGGSVDESDPEDLSPESIQRKVEKLRQQSQELMALPQAATQVISLCDNPRVNAQQLTEVIEIDPALSAAVIKRANSAIYSHAGRTQNVQQAVVRVGHRMIRAITTLMSVFDLSGAESTSFAFDRFGHWIHSLGVGVIAEQLAIMHHLPRTEDFFLAGILHDFGKLFFDDFLHDEYLQVTQQAEENHTPISRAEKEYLGLSHEEMGHESADRWKLPETVCAAIAEHHTPNQLTPSTPNDKITISGIVYMANLMCKAMLIGRSSDHTNEYIQYDTWQAMAIPLTRMHQFYPTVLRYVKDFMKFLKIPPTKFPINYNPPRKEWVLIEDGGESDGLLDLFLWGQQLRPVRDYEPEAPEEAEKPEDNAADSAESSESKTPPAPVDTPGETEEEEGEEEDEEGVVLRSRGDIPRAVIFDLRQATPKQNRTANSPYKIRHIVLKPDDIDIPDFVSPKARVVPAPLDYLDLLNALR